MHRFKELLRVDICLGELFPYARDDGKLVDWRACLVIFQSFDRSFYPYYLNSNEQSVAGFLSDSKSATTGLARVSVEIGYLLGH